MPSTFMSRWMLLSLAIGVAAPEAAAQGPVIDRLLSAADTRMFGRGYSAATTAGGAIRGSLRNAASETSVATLRAGMEYVLIGVCDEDCSDLDIVLVGPGSTTPVARDLLTDDAPIVQYAPSATGDFRVRVSMAACSIAPCAYAVRMYERRSAAASSSVAQAGATGNRCSHTSASDVLVIGDERRGILGTNSCLQGDGSRANMYRLDVKASAEVTITMRSPEMDAYLSLYGANGDSIESNDDGAGGTDAEIKRTLAAGTYYIAANVLTASSSGAYTLTIR